MTALVVFTPWVLSLIAVVYVIRHRDPEAGWEPRTVLRFRHLRPEGRPWLMVVYVLGFISAALLCASPWIADWVERTF